MLIIGWYYHYQRMLNQHRINGFDTFIINQQHSPRQSNISNYFSANPDRPVHPNDHLTSNNLLPNKRKTNKSPVRSPRNVIPTRVKNKNDIENSNERLCYNEAHQPRRAEYMIHVDGEEMFYCAICATQAASQGFTVSKIKKQKSLPHHPQLATNYRYQELLELMQNILKLQNFSKKINPKKIEDHYNAQRQMLNKFYDELVDIVQSMRHDHIQDFDDEKAQKIQDMGSVMNLLKDDLVEMGECWDDIEDNIVQIVQEIDQGNYQASIKQYRKKLEVLSLRIEEYSEQVEKCTKYTPRELKEKVNRFESLIVKIWENKEEMEQPKQKQPLKSNSSNNITVKTVHEMLPKSNFSQNGQKQGPFRNLFPDEDAERLPQASPQFKAF